MQNIFKENPETFGIIFKGKSLEKINKVYQNYDEQLFVNNFDLEFNSLKKYFIEKNKSAQMVNRLETAICKKNTYDSVVIKDIILTKPKEWENEDLKIKQLKIKYSNLGMNVHYPTIENMRFAKEFGNPTKYANTGHLACFYVLDNIKPKHLYLIGLDFYQSDYLFRRKHQNKLINQRAKMKEINAIDNFIELVIKRNPEVMFHIVTYFNYPKLENLEII